MSNQVTSVVFAGLGGLGVLRASDILADAAFRAGFDVKKSEVHGMSQRGGSVSSDVRYGPEVFSPMTPEGDVDFLVVLHPSQVDVFRHVLGGVGVLLGPDDVLDDGITFDTMDSVFDLPITRRNLNVALLGLLSAYLHLDEEVWIDAVCGNLPKKVHAQNLNAFAYGREKRSERNLKL